MNLSKLETILKNESKYRLAQVKKALFYHLIENWDEATVLAKTMREKLRENCDLEIHAENLISKDDRTIKAAITLSDGLKIETVLMRYEGRNTVCVSSQVGCPMACAFCATGKGGFKRNLTQWEIVEQVLYFSRLLKKDNEHIGNVVVMGMGEPFLNYDNVLSALRILNDKDGFNLGVRKLSVSTCGIIPGIKRFANEKEDFNLAISLNAPNDKLRSKLMPVNEKHNLSELFSAIDEYIKKKDRKVMFEYLLIKGVNDLPEHARELSGLMRRPLCFVNLIPYNPTSEYLPPMEGGTKGGVGKRFTPSDEKTVQAFKKILLDLGVWTTERFRFGQDIQAACGQLVGK